MRATVNKAAEGRIWACVKGTGMGEGLLGPQRDDQMVSFPHAVRQGPQTSEEFVF